MSYDKAAIVSSDELLALAEQVFSAVEGGKPDEVRARLQSELAEHRFSSLRAYAGSLEEDSSHPANYYLAIDALDGTSTQPLLVQMSPASVIPAARFGNPLRADHLRLSGGREVDLKAYSFTSRDHANLRTFAEEVAPTFLPRPQRELPAIAAGNRHPEISLPAVFAGFRTILEKLGVNMASTVQLSATREMTTDNVIAARDGEDPVAVGHTRISIRHLYHAGLWAAVRAGWRAGYTAEADHFIVSGSNGGGNCAFGGSGQGSDSPRRGLHKIHH